MKLFRDMKIGLKITVGFLLVSVTCAIVGFAGIFGVLLFKQHNNELHKEYISSFIELTNTLQSLTELRLLDMNKLISPENDDSSRLISAIDASIERYSRYVKPDSEEQAYFDEMFTKYRLFIQKENEFLNDYYNQNSTRDLTKMDSYTEYIESSRQLSHSIGTLITFNDIEVSKRAESDNRLINMMLILMIAMPLAAILLAMLLGFVISRSISKPIKSILSSANDIALGNMQVNLDLRYKDEPGQLSSRLKVMRDVINELISDINYMSGQHEVGNTNVMINDDKYNGAYRQVAQEINNMAEGHIQIQEKTIKIFDEFGKGNFDEPLEIFPGKRKYINDTIEQVRSNFKILSEDVSAMIMSTTEGKLIKHINSDKHRGEFAHIVDGINNSIEVTNAPLRECMNVLAQLADGQLSAYVTGSYKGDFELIKVSLNSTIDAWKSYLGEISRILSNIREHDLTVQVETVFKGDFESIGAALTEIINADRETFTNFNALIQNLNDLSDKLRYVAEMLAISSEQTNGQSSTVNMSVSQISESVSQTAATLGSTSDNISSIASAIDEMSGTIRMLASSSEETSAGVEMVAKLVDGITGNIGNISGTANNVSETVANVFESVRDINVALNNISQGCAVSQEVSFDAGVKADDTRVIIHELSKSSKKIGRVVDLINEIAGQTNILALNAAIEAAGAGEVGKGFAVVANEVKGLAKQTGEATEEIRQQIEEMQNNMQRAVDAVTVINVVIGKIKEITNDISKAVSEQTGTTEKIANSTVEAGIKVENMTLEIMKIADNAKDVSRNVSESSKGVNEIALWAVDLYRASEEVAMNSERASSLLTNISNNTMSISTRTAEVSTSVKDISDATGRFSSMASETNRSAKSLAEVVALFNNSVSKFKL